MLEVQVKARHDKATRELAETERKLAEVRAELEAERAKRPQTVCCAASGLIIGMKD